MRPDRDEVLIHDVKLPDVIEVYGIPAASVRRFDEVAFVCDSLMPAGVDGVALRHYSFPNRWWSANIGLDPSGAPSAMFGPDRSFPYDCDITTPHFEAFGAICNIDLKLDVFVRADGTDYVIADQEDFDRCLADGLIDDADRKGANDGLAELTALVERGGLLSFLDTICPLDGLDRAAEVRIGAVQSTTDVPVITHWRETVRSAVTEE